MPPQTSGQIKFFQKTLEGHLGKLMESLSPESRAAMIENGTFKKYEAGDILVKEGENSKEIGYVLSGAMGMTQIRGDGRRHIIGMLTPTDLFGRLFDGPSEYRIEALSSSEVYSLDREFFEGILRNEPQAEHLFLVQLLNELDAAREWLILISGRHVLHRVAAFVAVLARRRLPWQNSGPAIVELPVSRVDMAQLLGTRPETLSRTFHKLADMGLIRIISPYVFEITDLAGLQEIADQYLALTDPWSPGAKTGTTNRPR